MARETVLFKSEKRKDLHSVVDFLHQLADRLAQNEVTLRQATRNFSYLYPIKLSWK